MEEDLGEQKNSVGHTSGLFYIYSITFAFKDCIILTDTLELFMLTAARWCGFSSSWLVEVSTTRFWKHFIFLSFRFQLSDTLKLSTQSF